MGHSFAGGAATIAAAQAPELVRAVVEIAPFTLVPKLSFSALLTNRRYRRGGVRLIGAGLTGSVGIWQSYLNVAFPGPKPADYPQAIAALTANLREPGRMAATRKMGQARPTDAAAARQHPLPGPGDHGQPRLGLAGPAGRGEQDHRRDARRAGPRGDGRGAGHYAHTQFPDQVTAAMLPFLKEHASA